MRRLVAFFCFFVISGFAAEPNPEEIAFFDDQVLPLLKSKCYKCHGGEETLKGGLRLTSREGLLHGGELGSAVDETSRRKSRFLEMISYKDDEHQMPPKAKLSDDEIEIFTQWIVRGAVYNPKNEIRGPLPEKTKHITAEDFEYWAYRPVERPKVPEKTENPIDAFINADHLAAGIKANPRASRQTLIRRAFYDLTGLPPTIDEVRRFVDDPRPFNEAWSELIADLLSRPQYGEKWARHWLDLVRYAETNGFETDSAKPQIWRYRDYVVNALNSDKPYDQFVIEQLAGDEITEPTLESLAATGFHRIMQWDFDPVDRKQQTYDVLADIVSVTGEAFLGTTLGCARCHDHKADPITQRDYYSFMSFFHGITNYSLRGTMVHWAEPEKLTEFESKKKEELKTLRSELADLESRLREYLEKKGKLKGVSPEPKIFLQDARVESPSWEITMDRPTEDWKFVSFSDKSWIKRRGAFGANGITKWDTNDIWMRAKFGEKQIPDSLALQIAHSGEVVVYLNGFEVFREKKASREYRSIILDREALEAFQTGNNVLAVYCRHTTGDHFIDAGLRSSPENAILAEAIREGGKKLSKEICAELGEDLIAKRRGIQESIVKTRHKVFGTAINAVKEHPEIQPMHVQVRGNARSPGAPVVPAFPGVLHAKFDPVTARISRPSPKKHGPQTSGRRLSLAHWIASSDNPLTARVMVNRLWHHHFGRGIVPSTSDFGKLGEPPTHPALLDWLASELPSRGWSLKSMHELIMTSEAYLRSSVPSSHALEKDPINRLFWRFNMRRLTAEEIRDSILSVSGKLNSKTGGPWVCPPLPEEVLATASKPGKYWPVAKGDSAFRRSLYVHSKRSLRVPILVDHDQADTDSPCAVRFSTTVPTQALAMLNSKFVNQRAVDLRDRLRREIPESEDRQTTLKKRLARVLELTTQSGSKRDHEVFQLLQLSDRLRESGADEKTILERVSLLALNLNEFVYID